jgi:hypothetical protein
MQAFYNGNLNLIYAFPLGQGHNNELLTKLLLGPVPVEINPVFLMRVVSNAGVSFIVKPVKGSTHNTVKGYI